MLKAEMRRALVLLAVLLPWAQGCLYPEDCEVSLLLTRAGRYKIRVTGTLNYDMYARSSLYGDPQSIAAFATKTVAKLSAARGYTKVALAPDRRITFAHEHDGARQSEISEPCDPGNELDVEPLVETRRRSAGRLVVSGFPLRPLDTGRAVERHREGLAQLERAGFRFRYSLRVVTDMKVLEHNAGAVQPVDKDPRFQRYVWKDVYFDASAPSLTLDASEEP